MGTKFWGYRRPNGDVGCRNHLLILSGTIYANSVVERVANTINGAVPITHHLGRCQTKSDLRQTFWTLVGMGQNPNVGAVVVIDHFREEGCTSEEIAHEIAKTGKPVEVVNIREANGAIEATAQATRKAMYLMREISKQRREEADISELLFGLNCGTSDTTSGLSSNPALGFCSDRIYREGGRSILAEFPELMGAEEWLTARCVTPEVAQKFLDYIKQYEDRILATGEDIRGSQPTGDNIVGGISTIEEKSLGGAKKGGSQPIQDVLWILEKPKKDPGLYLMYTPGHGSESITAIAAAGAQILVFSTGGGHTINHPLMPTIKITGNINSWNRMSDTVDLDLSGILAGKITLEEAGDMIFNEVVEVLNGKMTKCEILKENTGFAIHRIGLSI